MEKIKQVFASLKAKRLNYMSRRPHRSFTLTRKRDIPKRIQLPGFIAFTTETARVLWKHRGTFGMFLLLYVAIATLLIGIVHQGDYKELVNSLKDVGPNLITGKLDKSAETGLLFMAALTGGLNQPLDQAQQINSVIVGLLAWLVVVWLLRQFLAGNAVSLRDGLYNAAAPFISTLVILLILAVQLVPAALGFIIYATANSTGILAGGAEAMAFGIGAALLFVLSLYWASSTALAGVIVTLPGTYPWAAITTAGDLAFGRRSAIVLRLVWLMVAVVLLWAVLLIPTLLIDNWLQQSWLPLVPVMVQVLTALSVLYSAAYIYLLYRKMIDAES
jgi:hypothetical protein